MSKQRNYPEGFAEAVAAIPFDQMQDFTRKIMQPTTPEPAPLLTAEDAQSALEVFNQPKDWWPKIQAIASGRVVCIDTQNTVTVPKMSEEQAREKARDLFDQDHARLHQLDPWAAHMLGYLAALRDAGVLLP